MKILFCCWGNICEPDMSLSLKYMGHEVNNFEMKIKNRDYDADYLKALTEKLLSARYDCVFSANYIPIISRACNVVKIKYISWTVDSPLFQLHSETVTNECNYIFIFDKCLYEKFKNKSPDRIFYMPLGTNVRFWDSVNVSEEEFKIFHTDVSFVGSLYEDKHDYDKVSLSPYLKGYLDGVISAQSNIYGYNFMNEVISDEIVKEFKKCADWNPIGEDYEASDREIVINEFLGKKCAEVERVKFVDKIAKNFIFDLYTLSDTSKIPHVNNRGPADSRIDMPKIFKCSKINLNMTIKTIETGIPLRIFDILGCKGFLITNYQSEIPDYFIPDEDLVIYEDLDDLIYKIRYYLQHEDERLKIAENGYEKVKRLYTYEHRLKKIFEIVFDNPINIYGKDIEMQFNEFKTIKSIISGLNINSVLDIGLFFESNLDIAQKNNISLDHGYMLDAVEFINSHNDKIYIYNDVYSFDSFAAGNLSLRNNYDIVVFAEVLKYLKPNEIKLIFNEIKKICGIVLTEYREAYLEVLKDYNTNILKALNTNIIMITL